MTPQRDLRAEREEIWNRDPKNQRGGEKRKESHKTPAIDLEWPQCDHSRKLHRRRQWIRRTRHLAKCYWTRSLRSSWSSLLLSSKKLPSRTTSLSFRCSALSAPSTTSTVTSHSPSLLLREMCVLGFDRLVRGLIGSCFLQFVAVPVRTASDQPYRLQKFKLRLFSASDIRQPNLEVIA